MCILINTTVGCTVVRGDQTFDVDHGDYFVDVDNCQRCLCNNGEATLCEPSVCTALQQDPEGCEPNYKHGDTFQVKISISLCLYMYRKLPGGQ